MSDFKDTPKAKASPAPAYAAPAAPALKAGDKVKVSDGKHANAGVAGTVTQVKEDGTCSVSSDNGKHAFDAKPNQLTKKD